jgi:hypothetical protein
MIAQTNAPAKPAADKAALTDDAGAGQQGQKQGEIKPAPEVESAPAAKK